jgi:ketosteroid isomerase-like protein
MYKRIAERRARQLFADLSGGEHEPLLDGLGSRFEHVFPGDHALGGERHSREAMRRWFERLHILFPELAFDVKRVAVRGWPWNLWIAVEWADHGRCADGIAYENEGAHWIRIRRGRGVYVHAYLDTEKVSAALDRMASAGIEEAGAPPITD